MMIFFGLKTVVRRETKLGYGMRMNGEGLETKI